MLAFLKNLLSLILPPRCIKCGKVLSGDDGLCPDCFSEITFITAPYCAKCGRPFEEIAVNRSLVCPQCIQDVKSPFRLSRSAFVYDDASKPLILSFKFHDKTENAKVLALQMKRAGADIFRVGIDVIIPVPLHYTRLIKRRYNQAALLAGELGRQCFLPVDCTSVVRHRRTRPQVEFSGHQRIKNVKDAFSVKHPECICGKHILLIDDVMTTGSTLKECALAMLKAGAASVDTLTAARVIR